MLRRGLVLAVAAAALATPAALRADSGTTTAQLSSYSVTSYVSIAYNAQYCAGATRFKMTQVEYRWYRAYTTRHVPSATLNYGELAVGCTAGTGSHAHGTETISPCFACGNSVSANWTPSYLYYHDLSTWPYGGPPGYLGAWVKFKVTNASGALLSQPCNQRYLVGDGPC
jgi:hypothetical protein